VSVVKGSTAVGSVHCKEHGGEVRFRAVCSLTCFASRGKNVEVFICAKIFLLILYKLC